MTFLDSSIIIDVLQGVGPTVRYVEQRSKPYLTSTICVFEVIEGKLGSGTADVVAARSDFGGVRSVDLTEEIGLEAARLQDALLNEGERMPPRDLLIAATAHSTGDHLVVRDEDFQTTVLEEELDVTNLADRL